MSIAFFISAHQLPRQFEWLYRAIRNPNDIFLIHLDRSSSDAFAREIHQIVAGALNVHFLPCASITLGGWSLVEANLRAIRFLCQRPEPWTHFVNVSGQDYPLKPVDDFRDFLERHEDVNFIHSLRIDTQPFHIRRRLHWYCIERNGQLQRLPVPNLRAIMAPVEWYGGAWCNLSRAFCDWLTASPEVDRFRSWLRNTKIPEEFFFQSIIQRSPFFKTLNIDPTRYVRFDPGQPHPRILTVCDLDRLLASSFFFARKFDELMDTEVLHQLAYRIDAKTPSNPQKRPTRSFDGIHPHKMVSERRPFDNFAPKARSYP